MAFAQEMQWNDDTRASDAPVADHTEFRNLECSPADGTSAARK
jgi:hypothetical protein